MDKAVLIKKIKEDIATSASEYKHYYKQTLEELDINPEMSGEALHYEIMKLDGTELENLFYHSGFIEGLKEVLRTIEQSN
ncbi:MAG: hypothetical protein ACOX6V_05070 [Patescibacteria group bacterium]|jgi:hypothetical protein